MKRVVFRPALAIDLARTFGRRLCGSRGCNVIDGHGFVPAKTGLTATHGFHLSSSANKFSVEVFLSVCSFTKLRKWNLFWFLKSQNIKNVSVAKWFSRRFPKIFSKFSVSMDIICSFIFQPFVLCSLIN